MRAVQRSTCLGGPCILQSITGLSVPRYFFNIYNGDRFFDKTGTELASSSDIRLHMISTALTLFETEEHHSDHWEMEAVDERGRIVGTLSFGIEADSEQSSSLLTARALPTVC